MQSIEDFSRKPDVGVMLVSLKAASLGVNLVSANHVVLLGEPCSGGWRMLVHIKTSTWCPQTTWCCWVSLAVVVEGMLVHIETAMVDGILARGAAG